MDNTRAKKHTMDWFKINFIDALNDDQVAAKLISINKKSFIDLGKTIADLKSIVDSLKEKLDLRDKKIADLQKENELLKVKIDDQEQYTRRASVRVFGIPETTAGTCDDKIMDLCNKVMKLDPPLQLCEIEVAHRTGKPQKPHGQPQ